MSTHGLGALPPSVHRPLPGERSRALVETLAQTECPALTARRARRAEVSGASVDPIVWSEARGANVVDADGNVYVDLTSGFGVAAIGHAHPRVVEAITTQASRLVHALGDVYPSDVKIQLLAELAAIAPFDDARVILGMSGADAVEAALETAMLETGRAGVLAFEGGYHGLSLGALSVCGYKRAFREPFAAALSPHVVFAPYPSGPRADVSAALAAVRAAWDASPEAIGAVLVEPALGRGGVVVPPDGFLSGLAALAAERGALYVADEIYTGLGRTGARWRTVAAGVVPDLLCVGKALGGGMPVSACLGKSALMGGWARGGSEALRTSTFLGQPVACAAASATLSVMRELHVEQLVRERGAVLRAELERVAARHGCVREVRGVGMMLGLGLDSGARGLSLVQALLERGFLTLPAGPAADVLQLSPPFDLPHELIALFGAALDDALREAA